jgi:hypothetical protein
MVGLPLMAAGHIFSFRMASARDLPFVTPTRRADMDARGPQWPLRSACTKLTQTREITPFSIGASDRRSAYP